VTTIAIDSRSSFSGLSFGYPTNSHSWDLETRIIREGRYMA